MRNRRSSTHLTRAAVVSVAIGLSVLGAAGAAGAADAPSPTATATPMETGMPTPSATPSESPAATATATAAPAAPADAPTGAPDTGFGDASSSTSIPLVAAGAVALLGAVAVPVVAAARRRGQF
jgi:hypothetical protein